MAANRKILSRRIGVLYYLSGYLFNRAGSVGGINLVMRAARGGPEWLGG